MDTRPTATVLHYSSRVSDPREDLRHKWDDVSQELIRAAEQAGRIVKEAVKDVRGWAGAGPVTPPPPGPSPVQAIRELAELRDTGLITEDEFQSKKTELLGRI